MSRLTFGVKIRIAYDRISRMQLSFDDQTKKGGKLMPSKSNTKQTSPKVASQAGRDLRNPNTPKQDRAPIASALAQAKPQPKKK
jgi:hypothetical protein